VQWFVCYRHIDNHTGADRKARRQVAWSHNKAAAANVMRNAVISEDINGLAASYDDFTAADENLAAAASCYLNDLFFYVFSKFSDWQNMKGQATGALLCRSFHACPR
jgi:hypothetical protein